MNLQQTIGRLSERYGVSAEAVESLAKTLERSGGGSAQFSHPELGGHGQWMPGMIQIGDMFNHRLKARVEGLCRDLSEALRGVEESAKNLRGEASSRAAERENSSPHFSQIKPMEPMKPMKPMEPMKPMKGFEHDAKDAWWPKSLGDSPNSSGGQNSFRYAYFSKGNRLAVDTGDGNVSVYDTGGQDINGVKQSQSSGNPSDVVFSSSNGEVKLDSLKKVDAN